jgi:hypothetical protein
MDFEYGPHFDRDLFLPNGKLARLHKGAKQKDPPPPPIPPSRKGALATSVASSIERNPNKRTRGAGSTILSTGLDTGFGSTSILGG